MVLTAALPAGTPTLAAAAFVEMEMPCSTAVATHCPCASSVSHHPSSFPPPAPPFRSSLTHHARFCLLSPLSPPCSPPPNNNTRSSVMVLHWRRGRDSSTRRKDRSGTLRREGATPTATATAYRARMLVRRRPRESAMPMRSGKIHKARRVSKRPSPMR